ncbi:MAG: transglutaminase domain-containing protein [Anaerolineales bacterium]|nr:transglutaminase domain-containing protein [Anaerolineales bacterium]
MKSQPSEPIRWWDLSAAVILVIAIFLAAMRLTATDWTDELNIIQFISFTGVTLGLTLGQSRFSRFQALWYAIGFGIFTIGWQMGLTFTKGMLWSERVANLGGRLLISFQNLLQQRAVSDPILFLLLMCLLFWALSTHAGYTLTRHANAWRATLPTGVALFIIHIYDPYWPNRTWFVASYIFLCLLLVSRAHFLQNHASWKQNRTHLPPYVGLDFLRATMLIGGILVLLSWTIPALASSVSPVQQAWEKVAQPWYEARARMSNAFASLRATVGIAQDYYGDVLPLGRGNTLTDVIVFQVKAPSPPTTAVRYYWRDWVYDTWNGSTWSTAPAEERKFSPDDPALPFPFLDGRWEASFIFYPAIQSFTIHLPSQPQWMSRPTEAQVLNNADGTVDVISAKTTPSLRAGETYEAQASLSDATVNLLRSAGTAYPTWIVERYLQLPPTLSDRTIELAQQIAEGNATPYDIASAVTQWMRDNITYSATVPTPPSDQDIIDWMLFDQKEGFCNYYATSEVMLLRSLGIPSRMAVGYAQGEFDSETGLYTVRQRDAHAWVEVYFPGLGWVEFEPTVNQRPVRRPLGEPVNNEAGNPLGESSDSRLNRDELLALEQTNQEPTIPTPLDVPTTSPTQYAGIIALAGLGLVILALLGYRWYRARTTVPVLDPEHPPLPVRLEKTIRRFGLRPPLFIRTWAYQSTLPMQARAYQTINHSLVQLGAPPALYQTPSERGLMLTSLLPTVSEPIHTLIQEYHNLMFANGTAPQYTPSALNALRASQTIRNQTRLTLFRRFLARFQQTKRKDTLVDYIQP